MLWGHPQGLFLEGGAGSTPGHHPVLIKQCVGEVEAEDAR